MPITTTDLIDSTPLPQAKDHLVYPWLLPGRLTLMTGPTDVGKTTLTLEIIAQLLKGDHLWGRYPARKIDKILYLHAEHSIATVQEAAKVRGDICEGHVTVVHDFGGQGSALVDRLGKPTPLAFELADLTKSLQPQLIIAEPISAFLGLSENDNKEVRSLISVLSALGSSVGAAVLTHHHVGKVFFDPERLKPEGVPAGDTRGAMAFEDAAERIIYLKRSGKKTDNHVTIESPKVKGFPVSPVTLRFDEDTLTYSHIPLPMQERDLIAIYSRRRSHPNETIDDMITYFSTTWGSSSRNKIYLMLKRAARVGLIENSD